MKEGFRWRRSGEKFEKRPKGKKHFFSSEWLFFSSIRQEHVIASHFRRRWFDRRKKLKREIGVQLLYDCVVGKVVQGHEGDDDGDGEGLSRLENPSDDCLKRSTYLPADLSG